MSARAMAHLIEQVGCFLFVSSVAALGNCAGVAVAAGCGVAGIAALGVLSPLARRRLRPWRLAP